MIKALPLSVLILFATTCGLDAQTGYQLSDTPHRVRATQVSSPVNGGWLSEPSGEPGLAFTIQDQTGAEATGQQGAGGGAAGGSSDAVKQSQNPIASLVSAPIQNNWNFGVGPDDLTQYIGLVQPVVPLKINSRLNFITRPILPLVNSPDGSIGRNHGLGDMQWQNFFVPVPDQPSKLTWGIGPSFIMPTASNPSLGAQRWGVGVSGVAVYVDGPVVGGLLINQNFTEGGFSQPFFLQPFYNYNFTKGILKGFFLSASGEFQADWKQDGNQWNNILGIGPGRGIKLFGQPMSITTRFAPYLNSAPGGPNWQFRLVIVALFPK